MESLSWISELDWSGFAVYLDVNVYAFGGGTGDICSSFTVQVAEQREAGDVLPWDTQEVWTQCSVLWGALSEQGAVLDDPQCSFHPDPL